VKLQLNCKFSILNTMNKTTKLVTKIYILFKCNGTFGMPL
jgi:hypothetical protein